MLGDAHCPRHPDTTPLEAQSQWPKQARDRAIRLPRLQPGEVI